MKELVVPGRGERMFALGNSGTGKSVLTRALFRAVRNGIAIDTKHDESWNGVAEVIEGDRIFSVGKGAYVWKTPESFLFDEEERNRFFKWALEAGNRTIYIDEFGDVCENAQSFPRYLKLCVMRGRSRGVGIWGTTQEPMRVPPWLFGQAQHRYCFALGHPTQKKLADEFFEAKLPWESMPEPSPYTKANDTAYRFVYKGPGTGLIGPMKMELAGGLLANTSRTA